MKIFTSSTFNLLFHNIVWVLCVVGRERLVWLSLALVVIYSFTLLYNGNISLPALALPFTIGVAVDGLLSWIKVFEFETDFGLIPLWLVVLWLSFASAFSLSLRFLGRDWRWAAAAGAIAMPLNYSVGQTLGAVEFEASRAVVWSVVGLLWGSLFPFILASLKKLELRHTRTQ